MCLELLSLVQLFMRVVNLAGTSSSHVLRTPDVRLYVANLGVSQVKTVNVVACVCS